MLPLADTNVLLRYLLNDDEVQSPQAKKAVDSGCEVTVEVLFEVVHVLHGHYEVPRATVAAALDSLLADVSCDRADVIRRACEIYAQRSLDFVDCILVAEHEVCGREAISFDKKVRRLVAVRAPGSPAR